MSFMVSLNKTAIVTGAASGMGLLFAQNWAGLGGSVVLCDADGEALAKAARGIRDSHAGQALDAGKYFTDMRGWML